MTWAHLRRPLLPYVLAWVAMAFARVYFEGSSLGVWKGIAIVIVITMPLAAATVALSEARRKRNQTRDERT
jgi:hypothetical protein